MELLTPASVTIRSNFAAIFTGKTSPLIDMDLVLSVEADKSVLKWSEPGTARSVARIQVLFERLLISCRMTEVRVKGLVSKPASDGGRSSNDRQFFYINGRPFLPPKVCYFSSLQCLELMIALL